MTSDEKLLQQALDALEHGLPIIEDFGGKEQLQLQHKAIAVLYEALRARLAQPKQEPVAWMYDWYDETEDIDGVPIGGIVSGCISKDYDEAHSPTMGCHNIRPLYTAPPRREWQGLTDEEVFAALVAVDGNTKRLAPGFVAFYCAIEAKLKAKNG